MRIKFYIIAARRLIEAVLFHTSNLGIQFVCLTAGFDLFYLYKLKGNKLADDYKLHNSDALALMPGKGFFWTLLKLWDTFTYAWFIYFILKISTTAVCFTLLDRLTDEELKVKEIPILPEPLITHSSALTRRVVFFWWGSKHKKEYYKYQIGHHVFLVYTLICFWFLPRFIFRHSRPIDFAFSRYLIDPEREVRRIDIQIRRNLDKMLQSLRVYKTKLRAEDLFKNNNGYMKLRDIGVLLKLASSYDEQLTSYQKMSSLDPRYRTLRPSLFGLPRRHPLLLAARTCILFSLSLLAFINLEAYYDEYERISELLAKPNSVFDAYELMSIVDYLVMQTLVEQTFIMLLTLIVIENLAKLYLSWDLNGELNRCLDLLQLSNWLRTRQSVERADSSLLRGLLRADIIEEEFVSDLDSSNVVMNSHAFVAVESILWDTMLMNTEEILLYETKFELVIYNIVGVVVATATDFMVRQQSKFWTILAERIINHHVRNDISRLSMKLRKDKLSLDFLTQSWRKRTILTVDKIENFFARVLGVELTLEKLIELNFSIMSLLLFAHNHLDRKSLFQWVGRDDLDGGDDDNEHEDEEEPKKSGSEEIPEELDEDQTAYIYY